MRAAASSPTFARFALYVGMFRTVTRHIILIALLAVAGTISYSQSAAPSAVGSAPVLSDMVRLTTLKTVDGKSFKLSDFSNKVVLINIWATWCGPCLLEMPQLSKINREYKSRGVVILGLATTYNENYDIKRVKHYLRVQKINYQSIWDDGTLTKPLVEAVQGRSVIPQSFVISKDGRIVKHFQGFNPTSTPSLVRDAIEQALKGNP
jgi:thiol-disulfide isomerase/thioredoxin